MAKVTKNINTILILRLMLGFFFIILGICGMSTNIDESIFSLGQGKYLTLEMIFGIVEIICGLILVLGIFMKSVKKNTSALGTLVILIVWIIRIIMTKFLFGFGAVTAGLNHLMIWLLILSIELTIGAGLLVLYKKFD